jgi:hypothetical protein
MKNSVNAPVVVFAFNRPFHLSRLLDSLTKNPEFIDSPLFIYCDAPRTSRDDFDVDRTRQIALNFPHPKKSLVFAVTNLGLANSITSGVTSICFDFERVIVLEDDLVVSPTFLSFMNSALERYETSYQVMQVSGHMYKVELPYIVDDAVFMPFTTSWGWGTWSRAWKLYDPGINGYEFLNKSLFLRYKFDISGSYPYFSMLRKQKRGLIDSWAIRWYLSLFLNDGLVLYPKNTLVHNEGFDGSGTHCKDQISAQGALSEWPTGGIFPHKMNASIEALEAVKQEFRRNRSTIKYFADLVRRLFAL